MDTSITFPGIPAIVPAARRFVRGILEGSPCHADCELIAGELISNAIRHTPAGDDGGAFTVTIRTAPGWARIEVSDPGTGQWHPLSTDVDDDEAEYGRGLAIVGALAGKFGHDAGTGGQTVWAEVTWTTD
jgi:anti-sigma regulatory factor (Ser/Thr protein kinase)